MMVATIVTVVGAMEAAMGTNLTSILLVVFAGLVCVCLHFLFYGLAKLFWRFNIVTVDDVEDEASPRTKEHTCSERNI